MWSGLQQDRRTGALEKRDKVPAMTRNVGHARGVLAPTESAGVFHHARIAPSSDLEDVVQHYWSVRWDLRGHAPQRRETLPHPNVHLVVERGKSAVWGVHATRFTTTLEGRGEVFGVKFRVGGFRALSEAPMSRLRNRVLDLREVFGADADGIEGSVLSAEDDAQRVAIIESVLRRHAKPVDDDARRAAAIVDGIAADASIARVEDAVARWSMPLRSLQRLFNAHVGVGPKWVIQRFRLHEALARIAAARDVDWTTLAHELGYFDQAHFIRDFKALVGQTPSEYGRRGRERY